MAEAPPHKAAEQTVETAVDRAAHRARSAESAYRQGHDRPLRGYALAMGVFGALIVAVAGLAAANRRTLPSPSVKDLVLLTAAGADFLQLAYAATQQAAG